jgi:energy-coupling factor transport system substrate-specific component
MSRVSTVYLLTCAAIGVAGGVLLWGAAALSTVLFGVVPFASVAIAGLWLLPPTVALRLLHRPLAGILVGLVEALTATILPPALKSVGIYALYLGVVFIRPKGLFGSI